MEATKQYGFWHGDFFSDPEFIKTCSEQDLYFIINILGGFIQRMKHNMGDEETSGKVFSLSSEQFAIEYCILQTRRFGVEIPEPEKGQHVQITPSYRAWFKWWNSYFQNELTAEELDEYHILRSAGKDISHFRPKGNWK